MNNSAAASYFDGLLDAQMDRIDDARRRRDEALAKIEEKTDEPVAFATQCTYLLNWADAIQDEKAGILDARAALDAWADWLSDLDSPDYDAEWLVARDHFEDTYGTSEAPR